MKSDFFQSCGHCWVFQICWCIECSTWTASSYRIWSSSTGIPPPPLDLFIVMLYKAHLTLHSRMSGYRWNITPSWFLGCEIFFVCLLSIRYILSFMAGCIAGYHIYPYAHKNTSMLRNPTWSYQAQFSSWAKSMQANLLSEEPQFYVFLPNLNLIHHHPLKCTFCPTYCIFLYGKLNTWESSLIPASIMHPKSLHPLSL